jgi:cytochrome c oxidase subunit 2
MIGTVYVMSEPDYNKWLATGSGEGSMAEQGQALFNQLGCGNCHPSSINKQNGRCPNLNGLFGTTVDLKDGTRVRADESYIRESVLYPQAKIVAGYDDIMPTFKGLLTEDGLLKIVEYVRSMGPADGAISSATPRAVETTATESTTQPMGNPPAQGTQPRTGAKTGNR